MNKQQSARFQQFTHAKSAFHEKVKTTNLVLQERNEFLHYDHIDGTVLTESSSIANNSGNQREFNHQLFNLMKNDYPRIFNVNYPDAFKPFPPNFPEELALHQTGEFIPQLTSHIFGSLTETENVGEIDLTEPFIGTGASKMSSKEGVKVTASTGTMEAAAQPTKKTVGTQTDLLRI